MVPCPSRGPVPAALAGSAPSTTPTAHLAQKFCHRPCPEESPGARSAPDTGVFRRLPPLSRCSPGSRNPPGSLSITRQRPKLVGPGLHTLQAVQGRGCWVQWAGRCPPSRLRGPWACSASPDQGTAGFPRHLWLASALLPRPWLQPSRGRRGRASVLAGGPRVLPETRWPRRAAPGP